MKINIEKSEICSLPSPKLEVPLPLLFIIYLFFFVSDFCWVLLLLVSMYLMVLSCIGGQTGLATWLTDCLPSNCIKKYFWRIHTYLLTYLLKKHHHTQTLNFSNFNTEIECTLPFNCDSKNYKGGHWYYFVFTTCHQDR